MNTLVTTQNAQIKAIIGEVKLLKNNQTSTLKVGDELVAGDNLLLSEHAKVTVQYSDGRIEVIYGTDGSLIQEDTQVVSVPEEVLFDDEEALPDEIEDVIDGIDDEISAIQSQIENGGELDLPDTAAGAATAGGGISFSSLDRTNDETLANTSFQSEAFTPAQASEETPEVIQQAVIITSSLDATFGIDSLSQTATISGTTTGVLPNSPLTITLTDSQGNQIVVENVTVAQDGSFSVDNVDVSSLSDGQISASVNVVDVNNQPVEAQSGDELDTTAPATPIVALNDANNDGFINFVEREAGVDATITLNDPNLNVGDTIEVVLTIGNTSTTSNILVTQEVIDNQNINVVIDENLLSDDIVVDVAATVIDDKGNRSETATDSATVDINVPGGDKDQSNQSQDAPTVNINEQIDDDIIDDNEASDLTARINLPQIGTEVGDSLIVTINGTEQPPITITQELIDSGFTTIAIPPSEITDGQNVEVTAKVTDPAGNSSSEGTDSATVDLSTPTSNVGPITDIEEANNTVSENASIAESTGVHADATDPDGDDVSYTLSDDADGRFTIDPTSGEITVAKELDFDNGDGGNHTVTVVATSTDGSTSTQNFTIEVTDADGSTPGQGDTDNIIGPVTDIEEANNTVSENASIGDSTGVHADATDSDGDDVSYTLSDDADGRFTIDPTSGEITVAKELDFDNGDGGNHVVTVVATSTDGSTSTQNFTIEVTDADSSTPGQGDTDNAIGPVTDIEEANNTVSENASIGDSTGIHADARDPDGDNVSYTLSDDAEGRFTIDPATGEIKVAKELNFENGDNGNHVVTVIATSTDGSTSTQNFTISVTDADGTTPGQGDTDNPIGPVTDIDGDASDVAANNTVSENASIGDSTGVHADAADPDGDNVSYTLSDDADGRFTINTSTGEITVAKELDFDNGDGGNHTVTVVATSADGSVASETMTITINNVNEADITLTDDNRADNAVDENATEGTTVGITALGVDGDTGQVVTYSLGDSNPNFVIDPSSGVVSVAEDAVLDHESTPTQSIVVTATSADGSVASETMTITITDKGVSAPNDDDDTTANTVSENDAPNTYTGLTVTANDLDLDGGTDGVTYAFANGTTTDGRFTIDATSGQVTTARELDFETNDDGGEHDIVIVASNTEGDTASATFTVAVTNDNDKPSTSDSSVSAIEDTYYYFTANDFDFTDQDTGDALQSVILTELSSSGTFQVYSGGTWTTLDSSVIASLGGTVSVLASQLVPDADGHTEFRFIASNNEASSTSEEEYANFKFKVSDGSLESEEATASIHVNAVADEPSVSVVPVTSITANGLTRTVWNQIDIGHDGDGADGNYGNGNGVNAATLVNSIEQLDINAGTSSNTSSIADNNVTAGEANFITGLVYLEAGQSYDVEMTGDDSYVIKLGDSFELSGTWGTKAGTTTSGTFTPSTSGYYTLDFYQHNQSGPGDYDLSITNASTGATPQMFTDTTVITDAGVRLSENIDSDGNGYYQPLTINEGDVNTDIPLSQIDALLSDTDGSESLTLEVIGVPSGMEISDGKNSVISTGAPIDISNWSTAKLTLNTNNVIVIDDSLDLSFKVTATESSNSHTASQSTPITVNLLGVVNDAPEVTNATFNKQPNANDVTFNLGDHVTDREDDNSTARTTNIVIESLPDTNAGTLVKVNQDGTTTPVTAGEVLPESTALRYIENTSPIVDASFNAVTDFEPAHGTNAVSSFTSSTGIELTGGTFSGATPTSGLTAGTLNYDTSGGDTDGNAIGVNGGELEGSASSNEYISAKFTAADVTNVTLGLSSVGSHSSTNSGAVNAVVKAVLFKDGVQVGEIQSFENLHNLASETNQPTITIDSSQEFDELRLFMTSTSSTSSMLLRSIDVNHPISEDKFTFSAIDANGKVSDETATVTFNMTPDAIDAIDDQRSNVIGSEVLEQTASDISELGSTTQSETPAPATQQREFNFGVENANKVMMLSFDALVKGSWDDIVVDGVTADSFSISANGSLLETHTYSSYESDPNNVSYDDSWVHDDGTHEYQVTLDEFGRAVIDFSVISTRDKETVTITNIEASLTRISTDDMLIDVLRNDETLDQDITLSLPSNNVSVDGTVVGTLTIVDNKVLFSPNEQILTLSQAQLDQLSFDYTISDGTTSDTATVKLHILVRDINSPQTIGSSGDDVIEVDGGEWVTTQDEQSRLLYTFENSDGLITPRDLSNPVSPTSESSSYSYSASSAQTIDAAAGNDYVSSAAGNDVIFAGNSSSLEAEQVSQHNVMTTDLSQLTNQFTETFEASIRGSSPVDLVNAGSGDDIIYGEEGSDILYGHTGNDYIDGGIGNDGLRGGLGNDTLLGQDGNDWLVGDDGNDTLIGGDGNDTIIAGLGDDIIIGGLGNDVMQSGQGSNTFLWLANELGTDTIEGFNYGEDKIDLIDLLGLQSDQSLESYLSFNFDGGNTRISIDTNGDGNSNQDIILSGTDLSDKDNQTIINTLFTKVDESEPLFSSNSVEETPPSLSDLDDDSVI